MMSRDPNPNDRADNFLDNQEIAEFLDKMEEDTNSSVNNDHFGEWADLLDDDFLAPKDFNQSPEKRSERMTFSDLPSDDEISEIFSENFSGNETKSGRQEGDQWQEISELETSTSEPSTASDEFTTLFSSFSSASFKGNTAEQQAIPSASLEDELASFFGAEESFPFNATDEQPATPSLEDELATFISEESFDFPEPFETETNQTSQTSDWDELKELLTGDDTEEAYAPSQLWQSTNPWGTNSGISPATPEVTTSQSNEQDELDLLSEIIGQDNSVSVESDAFDDLASLLDDNPAIAATPKSETSANESDFLF
ncbi:MAG: hypothetical protein HC820_06610 [Hydrococcus sp. RM1_1_31]|nr:hypothetical protein [Hydrococcus sp. RM1_1_31]